MSSIRRLLHIGSVGESVGVYVAAKIAQKGIGLLRVVIMAWMLASVPVQYGLVGAATALMGVLTVVVSLGGNHGMVRYASQFVARGQLRALAGRSLIWLGAGTLLVGAAAMVASPAIATHLLVSGKGEETVGWGALLWLSWACIANAVLEANYRNLLGLLNGLRAYRLIAALELTFATMFTLSAVGALALSQTVLAVLLAHGVCVSVMILLASVATRALMPRLQVTGASADEEEHPPEGTGMAEAGRLVRYGWPLVVSGLLGLVLQYASFYLVYRRFGQARAGVLWFFVQVSQLVLFIAQAAWAVVLTHVIARWEQGRREEAMALLRLASKGLSLVLTSVAVIMYASSPAWTSVLPGRFGEGGAYLPGLLMFFQMLSNIAAVSVLARVHERPIVSPILSGAALVANVLLAWWWMGPYGPVGASWAAGVAMVGVGTVLGGGYLLVSGARLGWAASGLMMSPMVLLAPRWLAVVLWTGVLAAAWRGGALSAGERKTLYQLWNRLVRRLPGQG